MAGVERREIKEASFDLLMKQTISIWKMGKALGFAQQSYGCEDILKSRRPGRQPVG